MKTAKVRPEGFFFFYYFAEFSFYDFISVNEFEVIIGLTSKHNFQNQMTSS